MIKDISDFIQKISPRFGIPLILSTSAWFIICYVLISPSLYARIVANDEREYAVRLDLYTQYMLGSRSGVETFSQCIYERFFENVRLDFSLWVASGKLIRPPSLLNIENSLGKLVHDDSCGSPPWGTTAREINSR
jgi:hypothetical protein